MSSSVMSGVADDMLHGESAIDEIERRRSTLLDIGIQRKTSTSTGIFLYNYICMHAYIYICILIYILIYILIPHPWKASINIQNH